MENLISSRISKRLFFEKLVIILTSSTFIYLGKRAKECLVGRMKAEFTKFVIHLQMIATTLKVCIVKSLTLNECALMINQSVARNSK